MHFASRVRSKYLALIETGQIQIEPAACSAVKIDIRAAPSNLRTTLRAGIIFPQIKFPQIVPAIKFLFTCFPPTIVINHICWKSDNMLSLPMFSDFITEEALERPLPWKWRRLNSLI